MQRALLVELLLHADQAVTREHLVDALWGERPPESAGGSLQVYVHGLRRALGPERIETSGNGYRLRLGDDRLDLQHAERLVAAGERALAAHRRVEAADDLRAALSLFAGEPLADLAEHPVALNAAGPIRELRVRALELCNEAELQLGRHAALLPALEDMIREQPYRERLRAQQIVALYRAGRQSDALQAYRDARAALVDDLGVEPGAELQELERAILRHDPALAAPAPPAPVTVRLPRPATSLVGRKLEIAAVSALLRSGEGRLVTLTGPGGTGKTRLALAVADEVGAELGGAVFVDLAPVSDPRLVVEAVAQALDVAETSDDLLQVVSTEIGERPLLLVLDNFEQLLDAAAEVALLLAAAPRLRLLVTSRAPLRLQGETEYPVPALPVPAAGDSFEALAANETVRLFAARARTVDPAFALDDENADAVASICRRLDGLPLAIELAAARSRVLRPAELERALERSLDLLVEGARDLPERQQTLRATLDWSFALLSDAEQRVIRRLAVFGGGWTLDTARAVLGEDVLPALSVLVEHSLVRRTADGSRFALLETIREYALDRLREAGEEQAYRERCALHFVEFAERFDDADEAAYAEMDAEHGNLRAALAWAASSRNVDLQARLLIAARSYWIVRGYLTEARLFFGTAIEQAGNAEPELRLKLLLRSGVFAYRLGELAQARAEWEAARTLARELGDADGIAWANADLAGVAYREGDLDAASARYLEAIDSFEALGNRVRVAIVLGNLATIEESRGDFAAAVRYGEQAIAMQREIRDLDGVPVTLHNLARARAGLGDLAAARELLAECVEHGRRLGYREVLAYALRDGGRARVRGRRPRAVGAAVRGLRSRVRRARDPDAGRGARRLPANDGRASRAPRRRPAGRDPPRLAVGHARRGDRRPARSVIAQEGARHRQN